MPINGRVYDFESISITLLGSARQIHVQGVGYNDQLEKSLVHSMGSSRPVGVGHGGYSGEGSITLLREGFKDLLARLKAQGKTLYEVQFSMTVNYGDSEDDITTDELPLCEFTRAQTSTQVKATQVDQELSFIVIRPVIRDGVEALGA